MKQVTLGAKEDPCPIKLAQTRSMNKMRCGEDMSEWINNIASRGWELFHVALLFVSLWSWLILAMLGIVFALLLRRTCIPIRMTMMTFASIALVELDARIRNSVHKDKKYFSLSHTQTNKHTHTPPTH